jgi:hypothetical protein
MITGKIIQDDRYPLHLQHSAHSSMFAHSQGKCAESKGKICQLFFLHIFFKETIAPDLYGMKVAAMAIG